MLFKNYDTYFKCQNNRILMLQFPEQEVLLSTRQKMKWILEHWFVGDLIQLDQEHLHVFIIYCPLALLILPQNALLLMWRTQQLRWEI